MRMTSYLLADGREHDVSNRTFRLPPLETD